MSRRIIEDSGLRASHAYASINLGSSTVTRVVVDDPVADFKPRPVGFTAQIEPVEVEPQTWDGDQA